jgi:flavodoxin
MAKEKSVNGKDVAKPKDAHTEGSGKKPLVVYYSLEGNTKFVAEAIAGLANADILELKPVKDISPGLMKYLWGGRMAVMKTEPELEPYDIDPKDYDMLFIGSPIWAWTFSPPIRTFLARSKLRKKKVALFITHGNGPKEAMAKFKDALEGNKILGEIDLFEPVRQKTQKEAKAKLKKWVGKMLEK